MDGEYGRFNNFLFELCRLLASAVGEAEPTGVVLPVSFFEALDEFDWEAATSPWACVVRHAPRGAEVVHLLAKDVFDGTLSHQEILLNKNTDFVRYVLGQLLLRPRAPLRDKVVLFEREKLRGPYDAVHLRSLEGACEAQLGPDFAKTLRGKPVRAADICHMSTSYVAAARPRHVGGPRPLFLAHDGLQKADADRLVRDLGAVVLGRAAHRHSYNAHRQMCAEMILLLRARFLIGNPASTMSLNVAGVREVYGLGVLEDSLVEKPGVVYSSILLAQTSLVLYSQLLTKLAS